MMSRIVIAISIESNTEFPARELMSGLPAFVSESLSGLIDDDDVKIVWNPETTYVID